MVDRSETTRAWVEEIAREVASESYPTVGRVTKVYPHETPGDPWDHNADVRPLGATETPAKFEKLPILVGAPGQVRLPSDIGEDYSLAETTNDGGVTTDQPAKHSAQDAADTRPLAIVTPLSDAPGAPPYAITRWAYGADSAGPTGHVNAWRNVIGDAVVDVRADPDGGQFIQAGFPGGGGDAVGVIGGGTGGGGAGDGGDTAAQASWDSAATMPQGGRSDSA